jgi:transposase
LQAKKRSEGNPMLNAYQAPVFTDQDRVLFDRLVPYDHWTRRADARIDFLALRKSIENHFSSEGRPAVEPILCLKLELLMFHDALSDRQVFAKAKTDIAYRLFLGLGLNDHLPDVSTLRGFRSRLGVEGHKAVFHQLLTQARGHGLVKDRLRIKDATHLLADIAIPAGLQLIAQARNKLLTAAERFAAECVVGERVRIESIRTSTDSQDDEARLIARVEHLRDILEWSTKLSAPNDAASDAAWETLQKAIEIAQKALNGHDDPKASRKLRSTVDPDARRGRHGEYYDGYFTDVLIDADSELFTAIDVLPADGNETADTLNLLDQEQKAHGNVIDQISIDGAGFDGSLIRELESRGITSFVPPKEPSNGGRFTTAEFQFSEDRSHATCPAGHDSQYRQRDEARHTTSFRFAKATCDACPLLKQCISADQKHGRSVTLNDYEPEYALLRERRLTDEYAAVKKEHPKVERRLGELVNRLKGRRARYRGLCRVQVQKLIEGTIHNVKRMLRLLDRETGLAIQ